MWRSLRDPELLEVYQRERRLGGVPPPAIVKLLEWLQTLELPGEVYAVTSLGELSLTTAPGDGQRDAHDSIWVGVAGRGYAVSYFEAGNRCAVGGRRCKEDELPLVVETYLLRLLLH
jgi:hypothetical protein